MTETTASYDALLVHSSVSFFSVLPVGTTVIVDPGGLPAYWIRVSESGWNLDPSRYGELPDPTPWSAEEIVAYYSTGRDGREFSYTVEEMGEED